MQKLLTWLAFTTLRKKWWRSDILWVNKFLYRDPIRRIPILLDTIILMKSQFWPREKMEKLVDLRLRDIVRRTRNVPLWKGRYEKVEIDPEKMTREDFSRVPSLRKEDFFSHDENAYTNSTLIPRSHMDTTSGSTGKPLQFHLDWRAELRYFAIRDRMFRSDGKRLPVIYLRGRTNPGFFFGNHRLFFLRGFNNIKNRLPELLKLVRKVSHGFILYGYSSSMVELAKRVVESGKKFPVRAIYSTGESLRESDRTYIETSLATKVFLTYATWEVKWVAHECEYHRYHINEEYVFVEIVDDYGKPVQEGCEGNILITSFESEAMPFIRYVVGDRGVIGTGQCPCGRTLRTIEFSGRTSDIIHLADGRVVPLFDLAATFDLFLNAIRQFRIIQKDPLTFRILIVPGPSFKTMQEPLNNTFTRLMHPRVSIEWVAVDEIPQASSGKAAYFVREF